MIAVVATGELLMQVWLCGRLRKRERRGEEKRGEERTEQNRERSSTVQRGDERRVWYGMVLNGSVW